MTYRDIAKAQLKLDEGVKLKPYKDTVGKTTIGVGRNLDDIGISYAEADFLLENDLNMAEVTAKALFPTFDSLSENRKAVLVNLAFNLGQNRLGQFKRLRKAVEAGDFEQAYVEMVSSLWASQVGVRATRLANQMREG